MINDNCSNCQQRILVSQTVYFAFDTERVLYIGFIYVSNITETN